MFLLLYSEGLSIQTFCNHFRVVADEDKQELALLWDACLFLESGHCTQGSHVLKVNAVKEGRERMKAFGDISLTCKCGCDDCGDSVIANGMIGRSWG